MITWRKHDFEMELKYGIYRSILCHNFPLACVQTVFHPSVSKPFGAGEIHRNFYITSFLPRTTAFEW